MECDPCDYPALGLIILIISLGYESTLAGAGLGKMVFAWVRRGDHNRGSYLEIHDV